MRRPFVAGNWKMNLDRQACVDLATEIAATAKADSPCEIAVCPPYVYLDAVRQALGESTVGLGGQDLYFENNGAFTGEISGAMLQDVGCQYVVLGHSERRHVLGETDADVAKKVSKALEIGLIPIVCVGETLEEREAGRTNDVVSRQIRRGLIDLDPDRIAKSIIAYEPVWAIGTGKVATTEQAQEVHALIRGLVGELFGASTAESVRLQYGGSVKPDNAEGLLSQPDIDGALVGGASLNAGDFAAICHAAGSKG